MSKVINLHGTKKGTISVMKMVEPYGNDSGTVASIAISLKGDTENSIDWKVHLPIENLDEVIEALQSLKS